MYAIVKTGGKQYKVAVGDVVEVEDARGGEEWVEVEAGACGEERALGAGAEGDGEAEEGDGVRRRATGAFDWRKKAMHTAMVGNANSALLGDWASRTRRSTTTA